MALVDECKDIKLEDLLKIKEKIGSKAFNKKVLGVQPEHKKPRESDEAPHKKKNRPQEMSSKKPVSKFREIVPLKRKKFTDPRFDNLYGPLNEEAFKQNYEFIGEIKKKELATLKRQFKEEDDPESKEKIKFLITRMENQIREKQKVNARREKERTERAQNIERLKEGKIPHFKSKREKKISALVDQYEQLKKDGKLPKYLEKKRKKQIHKQRRYFEHDLPE
ncbi:unnamed protein product [Bemisia tabaci]|uniref:rRNA biogenesis protein RRP36 n=1 Tax=Bemisia tabaci TaxID=7038 RepID=A0A9P0EXL0_BEMTA|nr:PREDICTED: ribosomal RNA processing protein 36 homolog [Bemisia tabaci]CAH0383183.1 unnamed protein product [Bemisia tabaci]